MFRDVLTVTLSSFQTVKLWRWKFFFLKVAAKCKLCLLRSLSKWWSLEIVLENGFWVAVDWSFEIVLNFWSDLKVTYSWGVTLPRYFVSFKWYFQTSNFLSFLYEIFYIFPDVKIFSKYKVSLFFRRMSHIIWFMSHE